MPLLENLLVQFEQSPSGISFNRKDPKNRKEKLHYISAASVSRRLKRTSPFISFSLAPWRPSQFSFRRLLISSAVSSHLRPVGVAPA